MTDAEYAIQRARLLALSEKWVSPLGLGWWNISLAYARGDYEAPNEETKERSLAYCSCDWRYGHACITWNMFKVREQSDEDLERAFVHELCVPSGTVVASTEIEAATSRWYAGEMVEISTAAGHLLACTPNHPILTGGGWVPAGLLVETEDVVSCGDAERMVAAIDPDKHQVPTAIEDIACAVNVPFRSVPLAAQNLDTESGAGEVEVVPAHGLLVNRGEPHDGEHLVQLVFGGRNAGLMSLPGYSKTLNGLFSVVPAFPREVRGENRSLALFGGGAFHTELLGEMVVPNGGSPIYKPFMHRRDGRSNRYGKGVDGLTGSVPLQQKVNVEDASELSSSLFPRSYPHPRSPKSMVKRSDIDASVLRERLLRGPGQVTLDKIVQIRRYPFRGHVHNLQTSQSWYSANDIITHNCHIFLNEMRWARTPDHDSLDHEERVASTLTKAFLWLRASLTVSEPPVGGGNGEP